jgi:hypothetical protein
MNTLALLWKRLEHVFFAPMSAAGFGLMRIAWALSAFAFFLMQWFDIAEFYSDAGVIPRTFSHFIARSYDRFSLLDYIGDPHAVFLVYLALLLCLLLAAVGFLPRLTVLASVILMFSFHERNMLVLGGGDTVLRTVGFLLLICPNISRFSLREYMARTRGITLSRTMPRWPYLLLLWQVIVIYGSSVWVKLLGTLWLAGTAGGAALLHPTFSRFGIGFIHLLLPFSVAISYGTLVFEAAWLLLLIPQPRAWRSSLKRILIVAGLLFHVGIYVLMDVGSFSVAMLVAYLGLLDEADFRAFGHILKKILPSIFRHLPLPLRHSPVAQR